MYGMYYPVNNEQSYIHRVMPVPMLEDSDIESNVSKKYTLEKSLNC